MAYSYPTIIDKANLRSVIWSFPANISTFFISSSNEIVMPSAYEVFYPKRLPHSIVNKIYPYSRTIKIKQRKYKVKQLRIKMNNSIIDESKCLKNITFLRKEQWKLIIKLLKTNGSIYYAFRDLH